MQQARMIGNFIKSQADRRHMSIADLAEILNCTDHQVMSLLKGRALASFSQLSLLAQRFEISVAEILHGNSETYNETVVHCMNRFQNPENREKILDLIDDYMDIVDAVSDN